jgi:hypothetical protein
MSVDIEYLKQLGLNVLEAKLVMTMYNNTNMTKRMKKGYVVTLLIMWNKTAIQDKLMQYMFYPNYKKIK